MNQQFTGLVHDGIVLHVVYIPGEEISTQNIVEPSLKLLKGRGAAGSIHKRNSEKCTIGV